MDGRASGCPGIREGAPVSGSSPIPAPSSSPARPIHEATIFSEPRLQPVWQWNHVRIDRAWSLTERPGYLRLHALQADGLWHARNTLTQRAVGPHSIPTAVLETTGLNPGDVAGFALLIQPDAWIGVERTSAGFTPVQHDGRTMRDQLVPVTGRRVWLRADCEYTTQLARFSYSFNGQTLHNIGDAFRMLPIGVTFQGVRYALFSYHRGPAEGGFADFDSIEINEPNPHGITGPIPYGRRIELSAHGHQPQFTLSGDGSALRARTEKGFAFIVEDRGLGWVALRSGRGLIFGGARRDVPSGPGYP